MLLKARWGECEVYWHAGDITTLAVDAIVNAANPHLLPGGGVSGAIHRRGGPAILGECEGHAARYGGALPCAQPVLTTGGNLPAKHVIHVVGPVYDVTARAESARLLEATYRNCLTLLRERGLRSIAFPCMSTGHYGYPEHEACAIAIRTTRQDVLDHGECDRVIFCTFDMMGSHLYEKAAFEEDPPARGSQPNSA